MRFTPYIRDRSASFPKVFEPGCVTHVLSLEDLYARFRIGEFKPLSDYIDFCSMVHTLVLNKDQIEGWHLISPNLDPRIPDRLLTSIDVQITQLLDILLERYVSQVPTFRNQNVVPVHVTESSIYLVAIPYDQ